MTDIPGTGKLKPNTETKTASISPSIPHDFTSVVSVVKSPEKQKKRETIFNKKTEKPTERYLFYLLIGLSISFLLSILSFLFNPKMLVLFPVAPVATTLVFIIKNKFPKSLRDTDLIIKRY